VVDYSHLIFLEKVGMNAVNVSGLKNNPSEVLRLAQKGVVVMNRNSPDALMVGVDALGVLEKSGVRLALATALFRDGNLSLVRASRLAEKSVSEFVSHVSRLGIPIVNLSAKEAERDMETLEQWLASS
jgi:predicted HTH domain antitoxin